MIDQKMITNLNEHCFGKGWNEYASCNENCNCILYEAAIRGYLSLSSDDERLKRCIIIAAETHEECYWEDAYKLMTDNPLLIDGSFLKFVAEGYGNQEGKGPLKFNNHTSNLWIGRIMEFIYSLGYKKEVAPHIVMAYGNMVNSIESSFAEKVLYQGRKVYNFRNFEAPQIYKALKALETEAQRRGTPADSARISYYMLILKNNCVDKGIIDNLPELNNWYSVYTYLEYNRLLELHMSKELFDNGWAYDYYENPYTYYEYDEDDATDVTHKSKKVKKCNKHDWASKIRL